MARVNIYIPDADHTAFKTASKTMKNAGHSVSEIIVHGLKSTPFWPKGDKAKGEKVKKAAAAEKTDKKNDKKKSSSSASPSKKR
jgi:hypothetical protein